MNKKKSPLAIATLTSKNQITLPKKVQLKLKLKKGGQIIFRQGSSGKLTIEPALENSTSEGFARQFLLKSKKIISLEEMEKAIIEGATKKR